MQPFASRLALIRGVTTSVPFGLLGLGRHVMYETSVGRKTEMYLHALRVDGAALVTSSV